MTVNCVPETVLTNNLIGPGITVAVFVRVAVHVMYEV